jgi:hypothetical protein
MTLRLILASIMLTICFSVKAQMKGVIADVEAHRPLRDATIHTNTNVIVTTNYRGEFFIASPFKSATITCKGFMYRIASASQMQGDTIYMIPNITTLSEVQIIAKKPTMGFNIKEWTRGIAQDATPRSSGFAFDFSRLFDHRVRHVSKKQREKEREALSKY